ncbi:MAG TPA: FkbM family methyltransferase [Methylocella sp.]|nr:FkbM family methyltransferase [Methylocella sp.]
MAELQVTDEDIRAAYRLVLGREADPAGFAHFAEKVAKMSLSTSQLFREFIACKEFSFSAETCRKVDLGGVFVVVNALEPELGNHIAKHGSWEPHIAKLIRSNLAPGHVFVDIGANVGVMSFHAATVVGPSGKFISFEPDEDNARNYLRGVLENNFESFVRLYPLALSAKASLFSLEGGSNTYLTMPKAGQRLTQSVRGDEILANEERIDFIKIDIEGHEPFALEGLDETIRRHKPLILCEFNPRCLRGHIGIPPLDFATQIFGLTDEITVIEFDDHKTEITHPRALVEMWQLRNQEITERGILPDGLLHFDLLFRAGKKKAADVGVFPHANRAQMSGVPGHERFRGRTNSHHTRCAGEMAFFCDLGYQ